MGQVLYILHDLPPKKSSLQKSWAFEFLNLTLKNREAVGNTVNPWAELRSARQNPAKKDLVLIAEPRVGIEPTFLLYESSVLPLNYIGLEPLDGIEPSTSSFVYTSIYKHLLED